MSPPVAGTPTASARAPRRCGAALRILALAALAAAGWLTLLPGAVAEAVIIAAGDGGANAGPPPDDPGWANVGEPVAGLSAVYLGRGWVLTANHVGVHDTVFAGVRHRAVAGSELRLHTPGRVARRSRDADLLLYRLESDPGLPPLRIAAAPPALGEEVLMIGRGRNRGEPLRWQGARGWRWGPGFRMRWGTNRVARTGLDSSVGSSRTRSFALRFDPPPRAGAAEAQAAIGDSGGAVFARRERGWELIGSMHSVSGLPGQPPKTSVFGDQTYAADLAFYRPQIERATAQAACANGRDDDRDGRTDYPADPGCSAADDAFERAAEAPCDDGFDDDGDGLVDFPADPGCVAPDWPAEAPDDTDGDGIANGPDNCATRANPDQRDTDHDGFGNACDADYDGDGTVGLSDFEILRRALERGEEDPDLDCDGDGRAGESDLLCLRRDYGRPPG